MRPPALIRAAMLAACLILPVLSPAAAAPVFPTGLRVGLEPAAGLKAARGVPGFVDPERRAAVTILDLPAAAYDQIARSALAMAEKGFSEVGREAFPFAAGLGFLIDGRLTKNGTDWHVWFLLARPVAGPVLDLTALVRVEVPASASDLYSEAIVRSMLASVAFRREPVEERLTLLPFELTDLAGLHVSKVLRNGTVVLTDGPFKNTPDQPYALVSIARGAPNDAEDYARFARGLLATAPVRDLAITSGDRMRINGQPGFEIRARGNGPRDVPITLVQWLRFSAGGFIRIVGVSPREDWDRMFNRFRALRDGVELR